MALEAGFGGEGPVPGRFADLDPCHGIYAMAQNIASLMTESISDMREAKGFVRIAAAAVDEYMPLGPSTSPCTCSTHMKRRGLTDSPALEIFVRGQSIKCVMRPLGVVEGHVFVDEGSEPGDVHGGVLDIVEFVSERRLHPFDASVGLNRRLHPLATVWRELSLSPTLSIP